MIETPAAAAAAIEFNRRGGSFVKSWWLLLADLFRDSFPQFLWKNGNFPYFNETFPLSRKTINKLNLFYQYTYYLGLGLESRAAMFFMSFKKVKKCGTVPTEALKSFNYKIVCLHLTNAHKMDPNVYIHSVLIV